ncbi:MAG TPA: hypothetical protein VFY87_01760, partial [Geminicoccaceae bacterium]|nr:hypothetical protein [Geminicoccaceae bacterium]
SGWAGGVILPAESVAAALRLGAGSVRGRGMQRESFRLEELIAMPWEARVLLGQSKRVAEVTRALELSDVKRPCLG